MPRIMIMYPVFFVMITGSRQAQQLQVEIGGLCGVMMNTQGLAFFCFSF